MLQPFYSHFKQNSILLEYSEAFVHKLATKLASGDVGMIEPIKGFIRFFDTIRNRNDFQTYVKDNPNIFQRGNKPITDIKNVDMFNATQLEHIYDVFNPDAKKEKEQEEAQQPITKDADLVFPDDVSKTIREINPTAIADDRYMEIYRGGDQATCTKFSHDVFGQSYNFCIGRKDASNMYGSYRLRTDSSEGNGPRTFYFVRDYSRPYKDDLHLIVVHALKNGNFRFTNSTNTNGDKFVGAWENLVKVQPKLAKHRDKFKFIPFSETEEDLLVLQHSDGSAFNTFTPRQRNVFLQTGKFLPMHFFTQLPTAEQNTYLNAQLQHHNLVGMSKYVTWRRGNNDHTFTMNNIYVGLNRVLDTHKEWGLSNVSKVDLRTDNFGTAGFNEIVGTSGFFNSLKFLKLNSKYYLDAQGNPVPRKEERSQPLKYFINHILNDNQRVITSEKAQEIFNFSYTDDQKLPRLSKLIDSPQTANYNDYQNTDFTLIKCSQDRYIAIYNETDPASDVYHRVFQASLIMLDSAFNVTSQPASILAITKQGFYVADRQGSSPYFIKITPEGEIEIDRTEYTEGIEEISNYTGKYEKNTFNQLSLQDQKQYLRKRLIKLAQDIAAAPSIREKKAIKFNCVTREGTYDHTHGYGAEIVLKNSKGVLSSDMLKYINVPHRSSALPTEFLDAAVTYHYCVIAGNEYVDFFNNYIQPTVKEVVHNVVTKDSYLYLNIPLNSTDELLIYSEKYRVLTKINLTEFKVVDAGFALILTKNSIIITDKERTSDFKKIKGYNKENGELVSKENLAKVTDTFSRMSKLRDNEAADVLATTYINYDVTPTMILALSKKTGARTIVKHPKMPPFPAKLSGKRLNPNTIIIKTQGNENLQNKYLTFLRKSSPTDSALAAVQTMLMFFNIYGIELSAVFFTPVKVNWRGSSTFTIGFLFAKEGINLDQEDLSAECENNSCYIEAQGVRAYDSSVGAHTSTLKAKSDFFTDATMQSTFSHKEAKFSVRPNIIGPIKTKNVKLGLIIAWFNSLIGLHQPKHLKTFAGYINQILKPDPLLTPDLVKRISEEIGKAKKQTKTQNIQFEEQYLNTKKWDLPFNMYYKVIDSVYD